MVLRGVHMLGGVGAAGTGASTNRPAGRQASGVTVATTDREEQEEEDPSDWTEERRVASAVANAVANIVGFGATAERAKIKGICALKYWFSD